MGEKVLLTKLIKFSVSGKRILCWSVFAIKPKADFCSFLGYWPSKNTSCAHGIKGEFVSLLKPVVLCTIAIESIADFFPFWGYWSSKNWPCDHDMKGEFVSLAKSIVFGTAGKRILCWSIIVIEPVSDLSLFLD